MDRMQETGTAKEAENILTKKIDQSRSLFTYLILFITEVARYAEKDALKKASKHLPTAEDLAVNTKIAGNELLWKILEDRSFTATVADLKLRHIIEEDLLKKLYISLTQSEEYKEYILESSRHKKEEKKILEYIFNVLMLPNENFINHVEEHFFNWDDDGEMMQTLVLNSRKRKMELCERTFSYGSR